MTPKADIDNSGRVRINGIDYNCHPEVESLVLSMFNSQLVAIEREQKLEETIMRIENRRPEEGDVRLVTKFLWFPLCIDGQLRWFETATIIYVYGYWCSCCGEGELSWQATSWA